MPKRLKYNNLQINSKQEQLALQKGGETKSYSKNSQSYTDQWIHSQYLWKHCIQQRNKKVMRICNAAANMAPSFLHLALHFTESYVQSSRYC